MKQRRQGFIMYDVIAAIGVLSIVGFGAFKTYYVGIEYLRMSSQREIASRVLTNQWERLRAVPIEELVAFDIGEFMQDGNLDVLDEATTTISIQQSEDALYTVTLSLKWILPNGRRTQEQLIAMRSF